MSSILIGLLKNMGMCLILVFAGVFSTQYPCEEDHECPEDEFCYDKRICFACYNCSSYYRKPHPWKSCSKMPTECGNCLPGYKADILTNGEEREYCTATEEANLLQSGNVESTVSLKPLLIGVGVTIPVVVITLCQIHIWRKTKFRGGDQTAQGIQSHNGLSPLLGASQGRKTAIEERMSCERPSAPPLPCDMPSVPPPPYEGHSPPLVTETVSAPVDAKLCREINPGDPFQRLPSDNDHEEDQESDGSIDTYDFEEDGITWEYLNSDTVGVSDLIEENSEPLDVRMATNSFLGVLSNDIFTHNNETHEGTDSGVSQASSSLSVTSTQCNWAAERQRLECGCYSRSEIQGDCSCRSEENHSERTEHSIGCTENPVVLDPEVVTLRNLDDSINQTDSNQANDSGVSQASSTINLSAESQAETEIPAKKRQKLNSEISRETEKFEDGDNRSSPENPIVNSHIIIINEPNDL